MLAEDGSIRTARVYVAPALNLYRKKLKLISLIALIVGAVGLVAYIALATVLGGETEDAPKWVDAFLVFAVPFTLGLIGYITLARLKSRERAENGTSECTFFADCFFCSYKSSKLEFAEKINYSDAVLKKENDSYGYIFVFGKGLFLVFSKEGLEANELNAIRKCFHLAIDGDNAELKNYPKDEENK